MEFCIWFSQQTGYRAPELRFSFKDVLPTPKINTIARGYEEHLKYVMEDIVPKCEGAAACTPGLSEFVIMVTVPEWVDSTS